MIFHNTIRFSVGAALATFALAGAARAQSPNPQDDTIDAIRTLGTIGPGDQRRIHDWVEAQVQGFAGFNAFRERILNKYELADNSPAFGPQLAAQTAAVAEAHVADLAGNPALSRALAQVLASMNRPESYAGLIALLPSKDAATRYLCAGGLAGRSLKQFIASDNTRFDQAVQALRRAGEAEADPVALERIYEALAYPSRAGAVIDDYVAIFDQRLTGRRTNSAALVADGAERFALSFFLNRGVLGALDAGQKARLAARLAVFMRADGERYNQAELGFAEIDRLERTLWAGEEILASSAMVGDTGGKVRDALQAGGHRNHEAVLREVYRWVGDPGRKEPGALNKAPWSVPLGAP